MFDHDSEAKSSQFQNQKNKFSGAQMNKSTENPVNSALSKYHAINRKSLDEQFYFQSLVDTALQLGLIDEEMIDHFQNSLIALLAFKVDQFTHGNSSSVRVEIAEMLMKSNLFTIGHHLKSFTSPDDALKCILTTPLKEVYHLGLIRVHTSVEHAKKLHKVVLKNHTQTNNETYNETLIDGIKGFFKLYDPNFEAHNIHITADYPTVKPITHLDGIEFILAYLKAIYHENQFCQLFDSTDIHLYLRGLHPQYEVLIINIFEPLLTGAIACNLLDIDETRLMVSPFYLELLYTKLHTLSKKAIYLLLRRTTVSLLDKLSFDRTSSRKYIMLALPIIASRLFYALKTDTLAQTVYVKAAPTKDKNLLYHAAPKMDDKRFREVLAELTECRFSSDRVALILKEVKAIEDFEDFVEEATLLKSEINAILSKLPLIEIAMLIERHPIDLKFNINDRTSQELLLTQCIEEHKNRQPDATQSALKRLSYHLSK